MTRTGAVALFAVGIVAVWLLMWAGWRARGRRQGDLPEPTAPTGVPAGEPFDGTYVTTTRHGDWLDRVVAHGLGVRSGVHAWVGSEGVVLERDGARSLLIPAADLVGAGRTSGMAGKFVEKDGLAVITWRLGGVDLDTGLRLRRADDTAVLVAAVNALAGRHEHEQGTSGEADG